MNLKNAKMAIKTYKKFLFGGGGLFTAAEFAFLLFFLPYLTQIKIPMGVIIPIVILAIAAPCFVMPLVYALINGSTVIATGRYHLPLVICALLASLFNVLLFNLHYIQSGFVGALLFLFLFGLSLTMQVYFYVFCSIGTRMDSSDKADTFRLVFSCVGVIIVGALALFFNSASALQISQIACIVSTLMVCSLLLVYMSSYIAMPFFIRIEPASNYSLKQNYLRYLEPLRISKSRLSLIALFLMSAGTLLCIECFWLFGGALAIKPTVNSSWGIVALVVSIAFFTPILKRIFKKNSDARVEGFCITAATITSVVSVLLILTMFLHFSSELKSVVLYSLCAMYGFVIAIFVAVQKPLRAKIKSECSASYGNVHSLMRAVIILALALVSGIGVAAFMTSRYVSSLGVSTFILCFISLATIAAAVVLRFVLLPRRAKIKVEVVQDSIVATQEEINVKS